MADKRDGLELLLSIVGDEVDAPEIIEWAADIEREVASMEARSIYQLREVVSPHNPKLRRWGRGIKVCGDCHDPQDAEDIARFFQQRDGTTYRYMWTDERRQPNYAWLSAAN